MKHIFNLKQMGLEPMTEKESQQTDGGGIGNWLIQQLILHWDDVKQGISDGWNGRPPSK